MEEGATSHRRARESAAAADSPFRRRWTWRTRAWVTAVGWLLGVLLAACYRTFRIRIVDPHGRLERWRRGERAIYAFWHDALVMMPLVITRLVPDARAVIMLSWHKDAEIAAQAIRRFGIRAVRGSSTRGWAGGLRGLLEASERGEEIAVVPDGPRGPRHQAKDGIVQLARATGLPVVAIGAAARPARRLSSWDRLQLPLPFARVALAAAAPVHVADAGEGARALVQAALEEAEALALAAVDGAPS